MTEREEISRDCVRALTAVAESDLEAFNPPIFNVVDGGSIPVGVACEIISRHMPVELVGVPAESFVSTPRNRLERLLEVRMRYFSQYVTRSMVFDRANLTKVTGDHGKAVTPEVFDRLVSWFVRRIDPHGKGNQG